MPAVECTGLVVRYGDRTAVDGLDLSAEPGEVLALVGPNGAGKTSTLECLEGYRRPAAGRLRVLGLDPVADHRALVPRIGVMLQRGGLYPMLGPRRALALFASYYEDPEDVDALVALVGLREAAATPWRHLSGGEQQRLALALALVGKPEVVFLDEPTAGVDPAGRVGVREVIDALRTRGVCVVVTTHELDEVERVADRVVIVDHGTVVVTGTPAELAAPTDAVRFRATPGLDVAAIGAAIGAAVVEELAGNYRVDAAGTPALTAALAGALAERDVALTDLRTGRTLEEVYLDAVGGGEDTASDRGAAPATRRRHRR